MTKYWSYKITNNEFNYHWIFRKCAVMFQNLVHTYVISYKIVSKKRKKQKNVEGEGSFLCCQLGVISNSVCLLWY